MKEILLKRLRRNKRKLDFLQIIEKLCELYNGVVDKLFIGTYGVGCKIQDLKNQIGNDLDTALEMGWQDVDRIIPAGDRQLYNRWDCRSAA